MIKKTLASHYHVSDAAASTKRTTLSYARDAPKIHYDADTTPTLRKRKEPAPTTQMTKTPKKKHVSLPTPKDAVSVPISMPQPPVVVQESAPILELPDVPLLAEDIVLAIMAPKLKKALAEIDKKKSIKQLTGGKSNSLLL